MDNICMFYELVLALREEYLKAYKLIELLEMNLEVDSDKIIKSRIDYALCEFEYNSYLKLILLKKMNLIEKINLKLNFYITDYKKRLSFNYKIENLNDNIVFNSLGNRDNINIKISDLEKFIYLYNELLKLELSNCIKVDSRLNRFNSLRIDGSGIKLIRTFPKDNIGLEIMEYNARNDEIIISLNREKKDYKYFNQKLKEKIKLNDIPDCYKKIMNDNRDVIKLDFIERNMNIEIKKTNKKKILLNKKSLR